MRKEPTKSYDNVQVIEHFGKPAFAVVPYADWLEITRAVDENTYIPHEIVTLHLKQGISLIAAWRKHKKMTQTALAEKIGVSQPALAQIEKADGSPKTETLKKIAKALAVHVEQLRY